MASRVNNFRDHSTPKSRSKNKSKCSQEMCNDQHKATCHMAKLRNYVWKSLKVTTEAYTTILSSEDQGCNTTPKSKKIFPQVFHKCILKYDSFLNSSTLWVPPPNRKYHKILKKDSMSKRQLAANLGQIRCNLMVLPLQGL